MVLVQRLMDLTLFAICVLAALSIGTALMRRLSPFGISRLEAFTLALSVGLLTIAYAIFFVGLLWLHRTIMVILLGVCFATGAPSLWHYLWHGRFPAAFNDRLSDLSSLERIWVFLLIIINLLAMLLCFVPPFPQIEWDSLSYHLAIPKLYWIEGRIHYVTFSHQAQFPFTTQMLYLLGLGLTNLKSAAVAKLFHWLFFVLCQLTLLSWGTALPHRLLRAGVIGAVAFATMPIAFTEATTAYVDLATTAFGLLALYAVVRFAQQPDGRWLILAGIFSGGAMGTKYTGALCVVLVIAFALWAMRKQGVFNGKALALSVILATAIASPWYVKNWLWTGNPVFPFAYSIFGGRNWSADMAIDYTRSNREFGASRDVVALVAMPLNLTLNEVRFGRCAKQWLGSCRQRGECKEQWKCGHFDNVDTPLLSIGALPLTLIPTAALLAIVKGNSLAVAAPAIALLLWFAWWFMEAQYLRYLLPGLGFGCAIIGYASARWIQASILSSGATRLALTGAFVYAFTVALWQASLLLPVTFGIISEQEFLKATTPVYTMAEFVNHSLPRKVVWQTNQKADKKIARKEWTETLIATYGEPLGYYFERRYFWADSGHNRLIRYERVRDLDDLMKEWRRLKVTHVIVHWGFVPKDSAIGKWIAQGVQKKLLRVIFQIGKEELLEINWEGTKR